MKLQLPYLLLSEKNPTKKYPLLILLDGDYLFNPFYGALSYGDIGMIYLK
jgi:hypothetical protein